MRLVTAIISHLTLYNRCAEHAPHTRFRCQASTSACDAMHRTSAPEPADRRYSFHVRRGLFAKEQCQPRTAPRVRTLGVDRISPIKL